jgi:hypothetical protein
MFNIDLRRIATATVGAILLTTTFVGAAVAPARMVETDRTIALAAADCAPTGEARA